MDGPLDYRASDVDGPLANLPHDVLGLGPLEPVRPYKLHKGPPPRRVRLLPDVALRRGRGCCFCCFLGVGGIGHWALGLAEPFL